MGETRLDELARRQPWLVQVMLLASALAVLAESNVGESDHYKFDVPMPDVVLDQLQPKLIVHVSGNAGMLPRGDTPEGAVVVQVSGKLTTTIPQANYQPVEVTLDDGFQAGSASPESVYTEFSLAHELGCLHTSEERSCSATFDVIFNRTDGGANVGSVSIKWSLEFTAQGSKEGRGEAVSWPWTVESTEE